MAAFLRFFLPILALLFLSLPPLPASAESVCGDFYCVTSTTIGSRVEVEIRPAGGGADPSLYNIVAPEVGRTELPAAGGTFSFAAPLAGTYRYSIQACAGAAAKRRCLDFEEFTHVVAPATAPGKNPKGAPTEPPAPPAPPGKAPPAPPAAPAPPTAPALPPPPVVSATPDTTPRTTPSGPLAFTGTWTTVTGTGNSFTMTLTETNGRVTGTYTPSNGTITGIVGSDARLVFTWDQGGAKGGGVFQMAANGQSFTGSFSNDPARPLDVASSWNGTRGGTAAPTPPPTPATTRPSFTGVWDTSASGGARFTMTLTETDGEVTGTYTPGNGQISGEVTADGTLTYTWSQDGGADGAGVFRMDADGVTFTGTFSNDPNLPERNDGPWSGIRLSAATTTSPATPAPPPPAPTATRSFTGTWNTFSGTGGQFTVVLIQTGNEIVGGYLPNEGHITGTIAADGKLEFVWTQPGATGGGVWTLSPDGNSITGTFSNDPTNPRGFANSWNGTRSDVEIALPGVGPPLPATPAPTNFTGRWATTTGTGGAFTLNLTEANGAVSGTYSPNDGTIQGSVAGGTLTFVWTQQGFTGGGIFTLSADRNSFTGTFSNDPARPADVASTWNGARLSP